MVTLSKAAQKMLETHGFYKCSKPAVPYRAYQLKAIATASYNKLYLMQFMRMLNEGQHVYRTKEGRIEIHMSGAQWVHAEACDYREDVEGVVATIHMVGIEGPVALVVKGDSRDAELCVDFTSEQSDKLGNYINPHTK